ncbi:MAG: [FeFe] hydrogenase H-cluster maturation GTPase HydF [Candidatus Cloacimonetes bacterium]|jgi:[FeFe] hydrogenase H-cluster maturation GTPase HydF|nr:[FeFe] hydrogenase H-cluster maturation GTPase HydF [Candidatus Cloacimonadota bacterium]NLO43826.1 [FeFe] hydrogenase H-cluster maturation GTPase HydF [Candidatus Cloacimonadota bacterium]
MSKTPRGERLIIALVGKRNAGKSSLINAFVGQEIAIVSEVPGTTTDPVAKQYELLPLGPVTFYDTAGVDDIGDLGAKRVASTSKVLYRTDVVIFVSDGQKFLPSELEMIDKIKGMKIPMLMVFNKADLADADESNISYCKAHEIPFAKVSAKDKKGIDEAKFALIDLSPKPISMDRQILGDIIPEKARIILVCPIDAGAPKGRLILPQVQTIRDILDANSTAIVVKDTELKDALDMLKDPPDLVVTDSQIVREVDKITPAGIPLTTFSILFARYKGELELLLTGINAIDELKDGDKVLIAEACSHHAQEDDIGRNKLPRWIKEYTGKDLIFDVYAGHDFPENLEDYAISIHCGGCMINAAEMNRRIQECYRRGVPITNYGLVISKVQGSFDRAIAPLLENLR